MAYTVGIIDLVWKGTKIDTEKGASFMPGGIINNVVVAGRKLHNSQEWKEGTVECTTVLKRGQTVASLYDLVPGELQVQLDSGQTIVFDDAFQMGERPKVTGGEGGKVALKWAVSEGRELVQ